MIVVDTGVLYALADKRDAHHAACVDWLSKVSSRLIVPPLVVAEACYLIGRYCGRMSRQPSWSPLAPAGPSRSRTWSTVTSSAWRTWCVSTRTLPLGGTDAAVVAVAERLGTSEVATVDHRHFTVVRPRHVPAFRLMPDGSG